MAIWCSVLNAVRYVNLYYAVLRISFSVLTVTNFSAYYVKILNDRKADQIFLINLSSENWWYLKALKYTFFKPAKEGKPQTGKK
jgi:hypothetical protein